MDFRLYAVPHPPRLLPSPTLVLGTFTMYNEDFIQSVLGRVLPPQMLEVMLGVEQVHSIFYILQQYSTLT